jgi:cystathionine gamma-synthase
MPRWADVVGYEEKNPSVIQQLRTGYPRFFIHRRVQELAEWLAPGRPCLPFPSLTAAEWAADFTRRRQHEAQVVSRGKVFGVATSREGRPVLQEFWQHTGLIVSSRQAEDCLNGKEPADSGASAALQRQLAGLYGCEPGDVFLYPTGMAAQFAALRAVARRRPGCRTAQLGFPYVDTFKLQQKFGAGGLMLHHLGSIEAELRSALRQQPLAACFSEIPGNPLLGSADLRRIRPILREHGVPLVADDVVATPYNIDLSADANLIATSLTKFIAGSGDVMGGALICNPRTPLYGELKALISSEHENLLWPADAETLAQLAQGFPERMARHNANGLFIAEKLRNHPAIERVWYPKWEHSESYEGVRRPGGGWGALVTFLPRNSEQTAPGIYDRLPFCKGPSLGTVFTLACPFTLLAHYTELDWAEACGVPRNLIRISVGLEDPGAVWDGIQTALVQKNMVRQPDVPLS